MYRIIFHSNTKFWFWGSIKQSFIHSFNYSFLFYFIIIIFFYCYHQFLKLWKKK